NIEIPLVDENGRIRSRRELRELRAQAEAEIIAAMTGSIATTEAAPVSDAGSEPEPEPEPEPVAEPLQEASPSDLENRAAAPKPSGEYSFPDIAPLDDGVSVFDDAATRLLGSGETQPEQPQGDFDDLIHRAVAQEGATGASTSALILPSMPET